MRTAREVFDASKLTTADIAKRLGLSRDYIYKLKAGWKLNEKVCGLIARKFDVKPVWIAGKGWRFND